MENRSEAHIMQKIGSWNELNWEEKILLKMDLEDMEIEVDRLDMDDENTRRVIAKYLLSNYTETPDGGICVELQNLIDEPKVRVSVDGQTELIIGDTINEMTNYTLRQVKELLNALDVDKLRDSENKGKWNTINNLTK